MNYKRLILPVLAIICTAMNADAQKGFSRGIEQQSFIPKGQWIAGLGASFSQTDMKNYQFLIVEGISGNNYGIKASPMLCYIFKDNIGAGGRFAYSRSRTKMDNVSIVIDPETSYSLENFYNISQKFATMAILRNYISIGNTKRFGLFTELQFEYGYGESKLTNGKGYDFTGTYRIDHSFDLGLTPGVVMFLSNYSAIEVNVGVLGFGYNHSKMTTDQIYVSDLRNRQANFRINIFSISFGIAFYL